MPLVAVACSLWKEGGGKGSGRWAPTFSPAEVLLCRGEYGGPPTSLIHPPPPVQQPMPPGAPTQLGQGQGVGRRGLVWSGLCSPSRGAGENMAPLPYQSHPPHPLPKCCMQPMTPGTPPQLLQLGPLLLVQVGCHAACPGKHISAAAMLQWYCLLL